MNCGVFYVVEKMERETRIELATNSLEGCDSTIELLPLSCFQRLTTILIVPRPAYIRRFEGWLRRSFIPSSDHTPNAFLLRRA